jgi:hypothetical protein
MPTKDVTGGGTARLLDSGRQPEAWQRRQAGGGAAAEAEGGRVVGDGDGAAAHGRQPGGGGGGQLQGVGMVPQERPRLPWHRVRVQASSLAAVLYSSIVLQGPKASLFFVHGRMGSKNLDTEFKPPSGICVHYA